MIVLNFLLLASKVVAKDRKRKKKKPFGFSLQLCEKSSSFPPLWLGKTLSVTVIEVLGFANSKLSGL